MKTNEFETVTHKNFHTTYTYDKIDKEWKLVGYRCIKCERTIKHFSHIDKHATNCRKGGEKKYKLDPIPETIVDNQGRVWQPFETNQKRVTDQ